MSTRASALLFPGQGSQEQGMGRDLAENNKTAMELWKKAERISALPLREIYWEGDAAAMADTRALQPALTVVNLALWSQLSARLKPCCTAGHSLGEYSSLAAAAALTVETVLELVSLRGRLMADADPHGKGTMAAILKLSRSEAESAVAEASEQSGEMLRIANYNTPGQFVASGTRAAIEALQESVRTRKGRAMPLPVSGAFHSPLMQEAAHEMAKALAKANWSSARFPVYCNATAKPVQRSEELLQRVTDQMTSSVFWIDTISNQWSDGVRRFVECGPKGVLSKMVKPILAEAPATADGADPAAAECVSVGSAEQLAVFQE